MYVSRDISAGKISKEAISCVIAEFRLRFPSKQLNYE